MPRIYASNNDPLDFHRACYPRTEEIARGLYGDRGDGPDGRGNCFGYDAEHPSYEHDDRAICEKCGDWIESENDD